MFRQTAWAEPCEKGMSPYLIMATHLTQMDVFNLKITEFANGQVEIRKYSEPIGLEKLNSVNMTKEQVARRVVLGKKFSELRRKGEVTYNPFENIEERIQTFEQLELEKARDEKNLKDSLNRTRQELYKLSRQCRWEYFITLTFSPEKIDRTDYCGCTKKACKWIKNQSSRNANGLKYVLVPELHSDNKSWHMHGLISDIGNISLLDSGKKSGGKTIYNLSGWKYGFSTAVAIGTSDDDVFKISNYITKYITKELCGFTKGKRRYFASRNIPKVIETTVWLKPSEIDNYIDEVVQSLGAILDYEKSCTGFVDVNYKYYRVEQKGE